METMRTEVCYAGEKQPSDQGQEKFTYLRKDHSPLEWGTMQVLTLFTVAVLGVKRISVELKFDISTPASSVGSTVE